MSSTPRPGPAPSHRQCLLPSVARTHAVTEVTPAKKITFLKRGDPRFAGVRLAVHQRAFKTFSALMDELSERMPLSFGVRSVTTPRGLHGLSALEQLQDGGCYFCSDKKLPKTPKGPSGPQGRRPSALPSRGFEGSHEAPETSSSWKGSTAPRRMTLVKNGDPRCQQTVVLSHRNIQSLTAFLSKASDLLRFPVRQVYTLGGTKVDSLQALLRSPSVLVCAGNEAFRPLAKENTERNRAGTLSGQISKSKSGCWGPKAKPSVIHLRPKSGSRPRQASLLSERTALSNHVTSGHHAWAGPAPDRRPQDTPAPRGPLVASDDVEKKVRVNEDGSLSVEMKVRFRLLGEDALPWSHRVGRASVLAAASGEGLGLGEAEPLCCRREGHPWGSSEPGTGQPCEAGCPQSGLGYEIWRNPLFAPRGEGLAPQRTAGLAQLSCCRGRWSPEANGRKRRGKDSASPASSAGCPEGSEPDSCRSPEGSAGSDSLCPASVAVSQSRAEQGATEGTCPEVAGPGGWGQCGCRGPRARGVERALSDLTAGAESPEESSEWGVQPQGRLSQERPVASQGKAVRGGSPGAQRPSPLSSADLQAEKREQGTGCCRARHGPVTRLPLAPGHPGSWDPEEPSPPPAPYAPTQRGRRWQKRPASAASAPSVPGHRQVAQGGHARQCHHRRDTQHPLDSPVPLQVPRPPNRGRPSPDGPAPRFSPDSPSAREQASGDQGPPSPSSLDSQDLPVTSRSTVIPGSSSDSASRFYQPSMCSEGPAGDAECRAQPPAPTLAHTGKAGARGDKAGGSSRLSSPSALLEGWAEGGEPGACPGCCCSQTVPCPGLGTPGGQTEALPGPLSEACCYCPAPPEWLPCTSKHTSGHSSTSSDRGRAEDGAGPRRVLPGSPGPRGALEEGEEESSVTPSALPRTSPDAVVREWLGNIPEQLDLVRYELGVETPDGAGSSTEGPQEDPGDDGSLKGLEELAQAGQETLGGDTEEDPEPAGASPGTEEAGPKSGEGSCPGTALGEGSKAPAEAGAGEGAAAGLGVSLRALPARVSASTQLMKALMGCKLSRPSSLPEVSSAVAGRLSRSAEALIACLASLHFFDEDLESQAGKGRLAASPRYQELLGISQALWPGCGHGRGPVDAGLRGLPSRQALPGMEDFTPTSSSGVDLSSGSAGSGEGSVPCATDGPPVPERIELPLEISSWRPDSRTSGHPEDMGTPQASPSAASSGAHASSKEEAERGCREQTLDHNLEQLVINTTQEGEARSEETEDIREGPQEEAAEKEGVPERGGIGGQDADGEPCRGSSREGETGSALASAGLCLPGRRENPEEPPWQLLKRDSDASGSRSGPRYEPDLEPRAAAMGCEPAMAKPSPGPRSTSVSVAFRAALDPDPIWVSKLVKKMEKAFLAHLAAATAELRSRWHLQDNGLLDQMVAELEQDMGRRLRESTDRELRKIQSRAGRTVPGPPQGQASLLTEQRRRRLQGLRNLSAFAEPPRGPGLLSFPPGDRPTLGTDPGTSLGEEAEWDEFCPCEACVRKKMTSACPKGTTGNARAPIRKAFDLQQILQQKKGGGGVGEAAEAAPENPGTELPPEAPLTAEPAQGADGGPELGLGPGPGVGEGDVQEESQGPSRDKEWPGEGVSQSEETPRQDSGDRDPSEAAGGQGDDGPRALEALDAAREGQPESEGGNQGEEENVPQVNPGEGQRGGASENSSLDQEGSPPGTPTCQAARCSPSTRSLGSCSRVSEKGSEDGLSGGLRCVEAEADEVPRAEGKVTVMYPESSASEQEEAPSSPRMTEQRADEGCDGGDQRAAGSSPCTLAGTRADGFGQDDLDF